MYVVNDLALATSGRADGQTLECVSILVSPYLECQNSGEAMRVSARPPGSFGGMSSIAFDVKAVV